jgi:hypothetical protein
LLWKYISAKEELLICIIRVFILGLLLKVRQVGVIVHSFIEVMHFLVGEHSRGVFKQLMVVIETKLSLAVVEFIGITVVMVLECFIGSLIVAIGGDQQSQKMIILAFLDELVSLIIELKILALRKVTHCPVGNQLKRCTLLIV